MRLFALGISFILGGNIELGRGWNVVVVSVKSSRSSLMVNDRWRSQ